MTVYPGHNDETTIEHERGTIPLLNISLCFNRKILNTLCIFLIKAFYPGCEITSWYEEDGAPDGEFAYYDKILYAADQICFSIENEKHEELSAACEAVEYEKDRHETKNVLKRMVYRTLSKVSGKNFRGRPYRHPSDENSDEDAGRGQNKYEIAKYMRETYYTSPEKDGTCNHDCQPGKGHLKTIDYEHGYSLYIGIPFLSEHLPVLFLRLPCVSRWEHMVDPYSMH